MTRATSLRFSALAAAAALAAACKHAPKEAPCPADTLSPAWKAPPLAGLIRDGVHVCKVPASEADTHAIYWVDADAFEENMATVDAAQQTRPADDDWDRIDDNWYHADIATLKERGQRRMWSGFRNAKGMLLVVVTDAPGDGAFVDLRFVPGKNDRELIESMAK
jgi:hypothetical protein